MKSRTSTASKEGQGRGNWIETARNSLVNWEASAEPGAAYPPLIQWLALAVAERGITLSDLADQLGVTYGYIAQIRSGARAPESVSDYFVDKVAAFLNLSRISVLRICGKVSLEEFEFRPNREHFIASAYAFIERDPVWGAVMPSWLRSLPKGDLEVKKFVIRLYQAATGNVLIHDIEPSMIDVPPIEVDRKGAAESVEADPPLIQWLTLAAAERGLTLREVATKLKVTYGYIAHLRSGVRRLSSVDDEFVDGVMDFLGLPRISVLAACGRVRLEDFLSGQSPEQSIESNYGFIERDKDWGAEAKRLSLRLSSLKVKELKRHSERLAKMQSEEAKPLSELRADLQVKLFLVRLYEAATGKTLIPYRDPVPARTPSSKAQQNKKA